VTGVTLPLSEPVREAATLAGAAQERFGWARAEVEADLKARVETGRGQAARPGRSYRRPTT
jgi:hypothetical protein